MKSKTQIKAGALTINHNVRSLRVTTGVKAGALSRNHDQRGLRVKSSVKAGGGSGQEQNGDPEGR